ncbi:hypothetical protein ACQVP2_22205 [Methylobacterium aquaticum]|uniref:hypothetical protein n=1 Tax=Methylobacterium aquaticum TaxID=270351 RepID=UPI003D16CD4A
MRWRRPQTEDEILLWRRAVEHARGLTDDVLAEFDAQAARFVRWAAAKDVRGQEIQAARREIEPDTRAVIAGYLPEVDVSDRVVRLVYGETIGGTCRATARHIWGELYILAHLAETGFSDHLTEFEFPVATAMLWWLHPLPDPAEWHFPRGLPAPRPRPRPAALSAPGQEPSQPEPTPRPHPLAAYEAIVSIVQPPPTPRWEPGVLRIEGPIYIREARGGVLIGTRNGESSRPDLLRRLTDPRAWFPAARWRDGEDGDHQGWFVPGSTAARRVYAWLDAGGRTAPRPARPPRKPRPTREQAMAAWRAKRAAAREEARRRAVERWTAERDDAEATAASTAQITQEFG